MMLPEDPMIFHQTVGLLALVGGATVLAGIAIFLILNKLFNRVAPRVTEVDDGFLDERRRIVGGRRFRSKNERQLRGLDEAAFARHLQRHPRDPLAVEMVCEWLEAEQNWPEWAAQMQFLLTLKHRMTKEEVCNRYHRLADLYLGQGKPERAREMLQTIVADFPRHYQATLARRRLAALEAGEGDPAAG